MSDRLYLYNKTEIASHEDECQPLMEWAYEFPLMLHPLVSSKPRIEENSYNFDDSELGLYAEAAGGIAALRSLYDFIDRHANRLVDDLAAFQKARSKIFQLLDGRAKYPWFHLDACSIFQDLESDRDAASRHFFTQIQRNNACIQTAMEQDNPELLDLCPELAGESWQGSFRTMFNDEWFDYGWSVISSMVFDLDEDEEDSD